LSQIFKTEKKKKKIINEILLVTICQKSNLKRMFMIMLPKMCNVHSCRS